MNKKTEAIEDCTKAIELDDKYVKAYLRRAKWYVVEQLFRMIQLTHWPLSSHVLILLAYNIYHCHAVCLLESPEFLFLKFLGPGKS